MHVGSACFMCKGFDWLEKAASFCFFVINFNSVSWSLRKLLCISYQIDLPEIYLPNIILNFFAHLRGEGKQHRTTSQSTCTSHVDVSKSYHKV